MPKYRNLTLRSSCTMHNLSKNCPIMLIFGYVMLLWRRNPAHYRSAPTDQPIGSYRWSGDQKSIIPIRVINKKNFRSGIVLKSIPPLKLENYASIATNPIKIRSELTELCLSKRFRHFRSRDKDLKMSGSVVERYVFRLSFSRWFRIWTLFCD